MQFASIIIVSNNGTHLPARVIQSLLSRRSFSPTNDVPVSNEIFVSTANARYFRKYTALCISNQHTRDVAHLYSSTAVNNSPRYASERENMFYAIFSLLLQHTKNVSTSSMEKNGLKRWMEKGDVLSRKKRKRI